MSNSNATDAFLKGVPKCELHLHIEGTFEPELLFCVAERNGVALPYKSAEELRAAYDFSNLQEFLDLYYAACAALLTEQDFYDLAFAYVERAAADNVRHVEVMFDPQSHTDRGVEFGVVVRGLTRAFRDGEARLGVSWRLIMSFLRHLSEEAAVRTLEQAAPHAADIAAVGLDSGEDGNPPAKFRRVFTAARERGFLVVAHAGEEGPASNIVDVLDMLGARRIDHGVRCLEDDACVARLARDRVPLTVCPNSNERLKVVERFFGGVSPVRRLVDANLVVTINSDDPAYFGGYMVDNFRRAVVDASLTAAEVADICRASFQASFLDKADKERLVAEVDAFEAGFGRGADE